jgi:predicted nucleic acid-binding protein
MRLPLKITEIKDQNIVIDTNIIIYYAQRGFKERTGDILKKLVENGNTLCISNITGYELFRDMNPVHRNYYAKVLNSKFVIGIPVDQIVLQKTSVLANLCDEIWGKNHKISLQDLLIMASSISIEGDAYILTCDRKDFKDPICITAAYSAIKAEQDNSDAKIETEHLYLLKVNEDLIQKHVVLAKEKNT